MGCCGKKTRYTILLVVGVILIALPLALHNYINQQVRKTIASNLKISPGSQIYDQWAKPTLPVYLQIHSFDIVNKLEVLQGESAVGCTVNFFLEFCTISIINSLICIKRISLNLVFIQK